MKENYTLLLSSQNATNRLTATKNSLQYYINWTTILPKPEDISKKYLLRFTFATLAQASFAEIYSVNIDFGGSNMCNQSPTKSSYLGLSYPVANYTASAAGTNTVYYYSIAKTIDNVPVTIEYPNNSLITVNLTNINTGSGTTFNYEYYLTLEFVPV